MKRIVDSSQMKFCDGNTITYYKIPSLVLMERAALAVVSQIQRKQSAGRALIVCGNGNNGADGLAIARLLYQAGWQVTVVRPAQSSRRSAENIAQEDILASYGLTIAEDLLTPGDYDCIVDALFGIGLSRPATGSFAHLIHQMNALDGLKVAVDMPSGVSSDTGQVLGTAFSADLTVTFAYAKVGQLLYPGAGLCGSLVVEDIGITDESWLDRSPDCYCCEPQDMSLLPERTAYSNKGTYGKLLVAAGSKNMAGAALFCGEAAYRTGCGLVRICTPEENRSVIQTALPEAVLMTYDSAEGVKTDELAQTLAWADVVAVGPGLGTGERARALLQFIMEHVKTPVVVDADGLNLLSKDMELLDRFSGDAILTPHLGEMSRLTGQSVEKLRADLPKAAREFAAKYQVICVLKDARTVTALPDGRVYLNTSGCSAMAKGGSGDILTGIIAGLMAQGMKASEAAPLGVYLHGLAGEAAAASCGDYSVLARDILAHIM